MTNAPVFRPARREEAGEILALYQSMVGTSFCFWDADYPSEATIEGDLAAESLFVLEENGSIIGALSVEPEHELEEFSIWRFSEAREIGRITVRRDCRGRGLAKVMVTQIAARLRAGGAKAIHLSAAKGNVPALKTYEKLGFQCMGEANLYGGAYYLLELEL